MRFSQGKAVFEVGCLGNPTRKFEVCTNTGSTRKRVNVFGYRDALAYASSPNYPRLRVGFPFALVLFNTIAQYLGTLNSALGFGKSASTEAWVCK